MVALSQGGFHSLSLTVVKYETLAPTLFHCHVYDTFSAHACTQFFSLEVLSAQSIKGDTHTGSPKLCGAHGP